MLDEAALDNNETLVTHFIMRAPPPSMPSETATRGTLLGVRLKPVKLDYDGVLQKLEEAGDGWQLRDEHTNPKRQSKTKALLEGKRTSIWEFALGDSPDPIGFCIAVKRGFGSDLQRITDNFNAATEDQANWLNPEKSTEIYKVALYRDYIGDKLGYNFLPAVQGVLLTGQAAVPEQGIEELKPSDYIYLNTRKTNLIDSRGFYQNLGYKKVGSESWPLSTSEIFSREQGGIEPSSNLSVIKPNSGPFVPLDARAKKPALIGPVAKRA